jgi:UDP:flavonoid glycosyltransferase YjiC (YdhE family)
MSKTITLLAGGTRGDVQPYVALGIGLRDAGYRVRVAAHDAFASLVSVWGFEFVSLGENPSDLFYRAEHLDALRGGKNPLDSLRASFAYWRAARPVYAELVQNAWRATQGSDALLFGLPTFWAGALANALQIPGIAAFMQPLTPTRAFPCPLLPFSKSLGAIGNRLSYAVCFALMHWAWRDALRAWRKNFHIARDTASPRTAPTLYAFSEQLVPRPNDYPASHKIVGFWFLPERAWTPSAELESFLRAGDAPIYVGFGSAQTGEVNRLRALLRDTQRATGLRFLIQRALADENLPRAAFCAVGDVPHAWLFPRVRAVIHHGGAGTTAAAARAGIPQLAVPMYLDSHFWGARVYACGMSPRPLPETKLSSGALTDALEQILADKSMRTRAQTIASAMSRQDGVTSAVEHLRNLI